MSSSSSIGSCIIAHRVFTMQDQTWFAQCSGDFNPVHLDPVIARRELPGAVVVHGVHLLLWALDAYVAGLCGSGATGFRIVRLKCEFRAPVYLDIPAEIRATVREESEVKLEVVQDGQTACRCSVTLESLGPGVRVRMASPCLQPWEDRVANVALGDLLGKRGCTPALIAADDARSRFGCLADRLGTVWIAELMAITRIVGMESPGWHSMLSGMDLVKRTEEDLATSLCYTVEEADARMGLVVMRVNGAVSQGTVNAFYRPGAVSQMRYDEVRALVQADEFAGQRALVIGGSRGIGEATAKLIAAGGGEVWLTYHTGREDARAVCEEVSAGGGRCRFSAYCVGAASVGLDAIRQAGFEPTCVYYFATPRLVRTRPPGFNTRLLETYSNVYVTGFSEIHEACVARWGSSLLFVYPSSVSVEEHTPDLLEYSRAKDAGEALCASLNARFAAERIRVVRLPMVATELSRGLLETESAGAIETMLPILRAMRVGTSL